MIIRRLSAGASVALAFAALGLSSFINSSHAAAILSFAQSGNGNVITGTQSGSATTIIATDAPVTISQIAAGPTPPLSAFLDLSLSSTSPASVASGNLQQHFSGSFSITAGAGDSGTNYLSGQVIDVAFGSGTAFNLSASTPPTVNVSFTSDVIPGSDLGLDRGAAFAFANVSLPLSIVEGTFASFTSSVSGTLSANLPAVVASEPASLGLLGAGLLGVGLIRRRRA